jgi:chitinase
MRRHPRTSLVLGSAALLVLAIVPTIPAVAAGVVTATFTVTSRWNNGHFVKVTVKNGTNSRLPTWKMVFDAPAASVISQTWSADVTRSGVRYTAVQKAGLGSIAPRGSRSWAYSSSGTFVKPRSCSINNRACGVGHTVPVPKPSVSKPPTPTAPTTPPPSSGPSQTLIGYFPSWSVYGRDYHVKNIESTGAAGKLTHLVYGFGKIVDGRCAIGDSWADYSKPYSADMSIDGVADSTATGTVRGNIGQLRKLKARYPNLKILWSIGGWTYSTGFPRAAANPAVFADSCYQMLEDPRWTDVFDGIDLDWEFPNTCGVICDSSGPDAFTNLMASMRTRFGSSAVLTAAITADGRAGRTMDLSDYSGAAVHADWLMPMSYGYTGTWAKTGPAALHAPLYPYQGIPYQELYADAAIQRLKSKGIPASKIVLGVDFYGRGWTGVTQTAPGGSATGLAAGTYSPGIANYDVLSKKCPPTGSVAGSSYAKCGNDWWSYDTPSTLREKMAYVRAQGLAGAFIWEISGDNASGDLVSAMSTGLSG